MGLEILHSGKWQMQIVNFPMISLILGMLSCLFPKFEAKKTNFYHFWAKNSLLATAIQYNSSYQVLSEILIFEEKREFFIFGGIIFSGTVKAA
jgi:hypothetical protein